MFLYVVYDAKRTRPTSCTNMSSLTVSGEMFLRRSMVSYMPCSSRSLSTEPSICFSSTRPTRNTIFTPITRFKSSFSSNTEQKKKKLNLTHAFNCWKHFYSNLWKKCIQFLHNYNQSIIEANVGKLFSYKQTKALRAESYGYEQYLHRRTCPIHAAHTTMVRCVRRCTWTTQSCRESGQSWTS